MSDFIFIRCFILLFFVVFVNTNYCTKPIATHALILARGGSKGIPLKNLAKVGGKTLLANTLVKLLKFGKFHQIWVSTDHSEIAAEAEKYHVNVHLRSAQSATDTASSIEAVQEFLQYHQNIDYLALIQCTSVFLKEEYLSKALTLANQPNVDCVFAVIRSHKLRWSCDAATGTVKPINFDAKHRPRRQDWNGELIETGMFYFAKRKLIEAGAFQNDNCKIVEIHQPKHSIEIDSADDLQLVNYIIGEDNSLV